MKKLEKYILSKISISKNHLQNILSAFEVNTYKKGQALIKSSQYITKYYFIAEGGIRVVISNNHKKITAWLVFENNFITDLKPLKSGLRGEKSIYALEDCVIYSIDSEKMNSLYDQFPEWQKFGRLIIEEALLNAIETLLSFQTMDAEARYLRLLRKSDAINRVPLKQLASYLGITPNSLSRIRKKIAAGN